MNSLKIRQANKNDAKVVAMLWHKYDLYEHSIDSRVNVCSEDSYAIQFSEMLEYKSNIVVLAEYDSNVVGVIDYMAYRKGSLRIGTLGNLFVLSEYRGKGIGSALADHVMGQLQSRCCQHILSGVRVNNDNAQKFWVKRGFKIDVESVTNYSMHMDLSKDN